MALKELTTNRIFEGWQKVYSHESKEAACTMRFGIYLPEAATDKKLPVIYWLSGLTCSEANFIDKAGAQRYAAQYGVILVCPDTSPRGLNIPGDSDSWDFGVGAGFYLNATQEPWNKNYRMYDYILKDLIPAVNSNFNVDPDRKSIMGHSMGGHGALILALKNPGAFKSVSAFAPICNPSICPWGIKAFTGYLGPKETGKWEEWDATELAKVYKGPKLEFWVDQGTFDQFLAQLNPQNLFAAAKSNGITPILKLREEYNHSYYYIASFIGEHIEYHSGFLKN